MSHQVDLIQQALTAAETSISLAKRLLGDLEQRDGRPAYSREERRDDRRESRPTFPREDRRDDRRDERRDDRRDARPMFQNTQRREPAPTVVQPTPLTDIIPGIIGFFDGINMVANDGQKYPVPGNYISKSLIVAGDQLKMIKEGNEQHFKQIQRTKRKRLAGVVTKKEGKFHVITDEGVFRILDEAVVHHGLKLDDHVEILTSASQKTTWAVVDRLVPSVAESQEDNQLPSNKPLLENAQFTVQEEVVVKAEVQPEPVLREKTAEVEKSEVKKEEKQIQEEKPKPKKEVDKEEKEESIKPKKEVTLKTETNTAKKEDAGMDVEELR